MLPIGTRELLPADDVVTAAYAGLRDLSNGELISRAVAGGFDVILTLGITVAASAIDTPRGTVHLAVGSRRTGR